MKKLSKQIGQMKVPLCIVCQQNPARERYKTCSKECSKAYQKAYQKAHQKTDKYKAYQKAYQKTDKYKAYQKAYQKAYYQRKKKEKK